MSIRSTTRRGASVLAAAALLVTGCTGSSAQTGPSPTPSVTVSASDRPSPATTPRPHLRPDPVAEPEDVQAYCNAIQAVHDAPDTPLGTPSTARAEAAEWVIEVAPDGEREYWRSVALVFNNTRDLDVYGYFGDHHREVDALVRERCGFGAP